MGQGRGGVEDTALGADFIQAFGPDFGVGMPVFAVGIRLQQHRPARPAVEAGKDTEGLDAFAAGIVALEMLAQLVVVLDHMAVAVEDWKIVFHLTLLPGDQSFAPTIDRRRKAPAHRLSRIPAP